jgi:serine/threonine-protein kinase RsbW
MDERPPATIVDIDDELRSALEDALRSNGQAVIATREDETRSGEGISDILFELPSDLALLEPVTDYLTKRIEQAWFMPVDRCLSLGLALREALVNAITHGNHDDPSKLVRITAEVSRHQVKFTVEDEGVGFNVNDIPHPRDPDNLLKSSGRGVLLIRSVMDETKYNDRGNRLSMIKRRASLLKEEPMNRLPPRAK